MPLLAKSIKHMSKQYKTDCNNPYRNKNHNTTHNIRMHIICKIPFVAASESLVLVLLSSIAWSVSAISAFAHRINASVSDSPFHSGPRKSFLRVLKNRIDNHISLTKAEQIFYDTYQSLITDKKTRNTKEITNTI